VLTFIRVLAAKLKLELIAVATLGLVALSAGMHAAPLVNWDEATYAEVAHEAVASGSYVNFTWNGEPYLKKPPMLFWMMSASFKTFGESEFAARLPSVGMGVATLLLICVAVSEVAGPLGGLCAGLIPLGFYFFVARGGRECATDAPLIFFSTLAIYALSRARASRRWIVLAGVSCGFAILSKGLAGFIPLAATSVAIVVAPGFAAIGFGGLMLELIAAMAVAAPWFIYEAASNPALFWVTFVKQETLLRVATHLEDRRHAGSYTLRTFIGEVRWLWPVILPLAGLSLAALRRAPFAAIRRIPAPMLTWIIWFALALAAACAVQTKLGWYILPALIPAAMLAGSLIGVSLSQRGPARRYCLPLGAAALALIAIQAPAQWNRNDLSFQTQRDRSRPSYMMAMEARASAALHGGGELFFAGIPQPTLVYYSGMRCHFVSPAHPEFELMDFDGNPVSILNHELVLRDPAGEVIAVSNFNEEWNRSGPIDERALNLDQPAQDAVGLSP
jgi:4-amino-4-deoxy-L-arabinose transferase-like glycosyltransferase